MSLHSIFDAIINYDLTPILTVLKPLALVFGGMLALGLIIFLVAWNWPLETKIHESEDW